MIVSEIFESQPPRSVGLALDGLIHLPPASEPVIDADEEVSGLNSFLLIA